jgi:hypothetical protein
LTLIKNLLKSQVEYLIGVKDMENKEGYKKPNDRNKQTNHDNAKHIGN